MSDMDIIGGIQDETPKEKAGKAKAGRPMKAAKVEKVEKATSNDQLVRSVPGTDVGGHDTAGVDGKARTERPGAILGTVNSDPDAHDVAARATEMERSDFVTAEVDRANREDLPRLGGNVDAGEWKAVKGGSPEFLGKAK